MIPKSPAERYIRYLLLHPSGLTPANVYTRLVQEGLDALSIRYITEVQESLRPPSPFHPYDARHVASRKYLRAEGVYSLFHRTKSTDMAMELLKASRAKEHIESLTLAGVNPAQLVRTVARHCNFPVTVETVVEYLYYFFDIRDLDATHLRALVTLRTDQAVGDGDPANINDPSTRRISEALRKAQYKDSRRAAANMPNSAVTAMIVLIQQGYDPPDIELVGVLKRTKQLLVLRGYEEVTTNGPEMPMRIGGIFTAVESIDRTLERSVDPTAQLRKQIETLRLEHDKKTVPTIQQLTNGNVSRPQLPQKDEDVHEPRK